MVVHTRKAILEALKTGPALKREIASRVFSRTNGAARQTKIDKAWKNLRDEGRIQPKGKKFMSAEVEVAA